MSSATAEGSMTQSGVQSGWFAGLWRGRWKYLAGAIMIALSVVMLLPIYATVTASLKLPAEAAGIPPTYFPQSFTFESYAKLWDYQHGLPRYLFNSFATAFLSIIFTVMLTVPAGFALARFPIPGKEALFVLLLTSLIIPYQALLTPIFLMFAQLKLDAEINCIEFITKLQYPLLDLMQQLFCIFLLIRLIFFQ